MNNYIAYLDVLVLAMFMGIIVTMALSNYDNDDSTVCIYFVFVYMLQYIDAPTCIP